MSIDIDFDQIEQGIYNAEEVLSFAPTPKGSLQRRQQGANSSNIFFYDQEYAEDAKSSRADAKFSDSMADTIRFTAPVDAAIRSVDYSSSAPYYQHATAHILGDGPETHSDDADEEDSLPRQSVPVAKSPVRSRHNLEQPGQSKKPPARPISMERIQELHQSRVIRQQNLMKERRALDELALAECTFKPQISRGTRNILHQKSQFEQLDQDCRTVGEHEVTQEPANAESDVSQRLYKEAAVRSAQHRWVQQEVEKARQMHYTFQPMLNPRARAAQDDRRPIHERIADMQKEKKQYLQALKASIEEEQVDLTFRPHIDARSRVLAEQKLMGYGGNPHLVAAERPTTAPAGAVRMVPQRDAAMQAGALSGAAEAALVLGFHADVGSRLMDQGRQAAKRKQQLLHERDNELAKAMEQAAISRGSEKIAQRSAECQGNFEERQVRYQSREKQRRDAVLREEETRTNAWFRPHVDEHSRQIVKEARPEVMLESAVQRSERLAVTDAQQIEERRRRRAAEIYGAYTFTPSIDPESRAIGHSSSIEELVQNRRALAAKERIRQRVEEDRVQACTFRPQINELSRQLMDPSAEDAFLANYAREYAHVGWAQGQGEGGGGRAGCSLDVSVDPALRMNLQRARNGRINMQEPERMARDIRAHLLEKEEKRRGELMAQEIEELRDCTFRPSIDHSLASLERQRRDTSPVVIRGLGRYLELKHLSVRQREEAAEREKEVFSVRNVDKFRRPEDGSTMVQEFSFHLTEPKQHSRLDISKGDEVNPGSLNASTIISHRSHRQATSPEAAAAWVV